MTPKIEEKRGELAGWSIEDVGDWLERISLSHLVTKFQEEKVDGPTLLSLTDVGLRRDLGFKLGEITKLFAEREKLVPKETGLLIFLLCGSWLVVVGVGCGLAPGKRKFRKRREYIFAVDCGFAPSCGSFSNQDRWFVFSLFLAG